MMSDARGARAAAHTVRASAPRCGGACEVRGARRARATGVEPADDTSHRDPRVDPMDDASEGSRCDDNHSPNRASFQSRRPCTSHSTVPRDPLLGERTVPMTVHPHPISPPIVEVAGACCSRPGRRRRSSGSVSKADLAATSVTEKQVVIVERVDEPAAVAAVGSRLRRAQPVIAP